MPPSYPAGSYPAKVVADGAVAYWRLGETSGLTAVDVIAGANGTISGGVMLGQAGALSDGDKAMLFDGTTGKIATPSITIPDIFTVEAWAKLPSGTTGYEPIVGTHTGAQAAGQFMLGYYNANRIVLQAEPGGLYFGSIQTLAEDSWHHLVVVFTGAQISAFNDGVETIAPTAQAHISSANVLNIGWDFFYGFYIGAVDEVAIYPTALTAPQIAAHYAAKTWTAMPDIRWRWCRYVPRQARR